MGCESETAQVRTLLIELFDGNGIDYQLEQDGNRLVFTIRPPLESRLGPLSLNFEAWLELRWEFGYLYDFFFLTQPWVEGVTEFWRGVFDERIVFSARLESGQCAAGGPVWLEQDEMPAGMVIRSWWGNLNREP